MRLVRLIPFMVVATLGAIAPLAAEDAATPSSEGIYRLPYVDDTEVTIFDDVRSHRPAGRIDFYATVGKAPYEVVAAADGRVVAIQDSYSEQQSGRAAKDCHNNFVWIAHANGEWTNYSHIAKGSASQTAGLKVGDHVKAGQVIGIEDAVGCAMLKHVHFEVARPADGAAIDTGGFLLDNENGKRERDPRFCKSPDASLIKSKVYIAGPCNDQV